jgi:predicted TIM-barrel fold metal-dependent hydrolase
MISRRQVLGRMAAVGAGAGLAACGAASTTAGSSPDAVPSDKRCRCKPCEPCPGPDDIRELRLRDWEPRSMLKTRVTEVEKAAFPVIDAHNHLGRAKTRADVKKVLRAMDEAGVRTVVNLDGMWGGDLRKALARLDRAHPGRFLTYALIDMEGIDERGWTRRTAKQLERDFRAGAKGLKFHKSLGLGVRGKDDKLIKVDDARLDPIWALCAKYRRPVAIHTSDPAAFFTPLDRYNERWHELNEHPDWLFHGEDYPSRDELLEQRNRVIARHPRTIFVAAHFANNPEDLETVGKWLDRYPNLYIDIDARISELGRQPYSARRFIIKYQDRVLFGTDTFPKSPKIFRVYYRFLETEDEYWDCAAGHHRQGFWMIYGIHLPREVLEKVYRRNAKKVLALSVK